MPGIVLKFYKGVRERERENGASGNNLSGVSAFIRERVGYLESDIKLMTA